MAKEKNTGETAAMLLGMLAGSWILTILIYLAVFIPDFKASLASTFGHHWSGKVVISYISFAIVWLIARVGLKNKNVGTTKTWTWISIVCLILVIILISALMTWHYFTE